MTKNGRPEKVGHFCLCLLTEIIIPVGAIKSLPISCSTG